MKWEYWNPREVDIIHSLKFEERKLRLLLARHFPDEEKKIRVVYYHFPSEESHIMAYAHMDEGTIEINKHFLLSVSIEENIDTLRHEFAHFFSFYEIGDVWIKRKGKEIYWPHNKNWKKWCRLLGCRPYACSKKNAAKVASIEKNH